jgi:FkbM family methyltransferase
MDYDHEAPVAAFLQEHVRPEMLCLDIGANIGVYVLQLAHWTRPGGRIIAFEPNPAACEVLMRHVRMNGLSSRVDAVAAAVGASPGQEVFYSSGTHGMSRLSAPNPELAHQVVASTVPVITLDQHCLEHDLNPDVLLMDIEGFEIAALRGARAVIEGRRRQILICVEMHPRLWNLSGEGRKDMEDLLRRLGLVPIPLTGQADPLGENGVVHLQYRGDRS